MLNSALPCGRRSKARLFLVPRQHVGTAEGAKSGCSTRALEKGFQVVKVDPNGRSNCSATRAVPHEVYPGQPKLLLFAKRQQLALRDALNTDGNLADLLMVSALGSAPPNTPARHRS